MPKTGEAPDEGHDAEGGAGSAEEFKDVCLVISLQNLGCPVRCVRDGPFSIADGNSWLQPLGVHLRKKNDTTKLFDGKYIVHDEHLKHFFALEVREGCFVQKDGENINTLTFGEVMN